MDVHGAFASGSGYFPFMPTLSTLHLTCLKVLLMLVPVLAASPFTLATNSTSLMVFYIKIIIKKIAVSYIC